MPTSQPYQLGSILELVVRSKPQSVLDIGVGFGKYGYLVREYLEIWGEGDQYDQWLRTIDGVEVFEPYIRKVQRTVYNDIFIGNATELLSDLHVIAAEWRERITEKRFELCNQEWIRFVANAGAPGSYDDEASYDAYGTGTGARSASRSGFR